MNLPVQPILGPEDVEVFSFENMLASSFDDGERLREVQASAIHDYLLVGGGIFPIGVGLGKTGISLAIANLAFEAGLRKIMLMIPPAQVRGLARRHIPEWRKRIPLDVPFHYMAGRTREARWTIATSDMPGVYVMPYSLISAEFGLEELEAIGPELIIADEVHNLKHKKSARTGRVEEYLKAAGPQFVGMSGTITSKSLKDYQHLMLYALGNKAPVPLLWSTLDKVDEVINSDAESATSSRALGVRLMRPFLSWAREHFPDEEFKRGETESLRRAFRHRMHVTPGVVASGDAEFGVSIGFLNIDVPLKTLQAEPNWSELNEMLVAVDDPMVTPAGEDIDHGFHKYKWKRELSSGFYHKLFWPEPEDFAERRRLKQQVADSILERAKDYHECHLVYQKLCREFFKSPPRGIDTPMKLGQELARRGAQNVGTELHETWLELKRMDFEGRPDRDAEMVRVCPFKVNMAIRWAKAVETGIIWVWHPEFGLWVIEALLEAGIDAEWFAAGDSTIEDIGDPELGGQGDKIIVAGMGGHGTGRNLQAFERALLLEYPREPVIAEQTSGRIHRPGQKQDHVDIYTALVTGFDHQNRGACLNDAIYIQQSTGQHQKIVYADYDPLPQVFGREFLREQGIDGVKKLTKEQQKMLRRVSGDNL